MSDYFEEIYAVFHRDSYLGSVGKKDGLWYCASVPYLKLEDAINIGLRGMVC